MSEETVFHMTQSAYEELQAELKHRIEVERPKLAKRLQAARELGDLSENADYIAAKEEQGFLEGRIQQLQAMIRYAVIIEENNGPGDVVRLGSTVTVHQDGEDTPETFTIVGRVEANPRQGKISNESPLGTALIGRRVGETVRYNAPSGELVFTIKSIS